MTAKRRVPTVDLTNPPPGHRLELVGICAFLGVTINDLANACGVSRTTMSRIATTNTWPERRSRNEIQELARQYLTVAGATPEMIAAAFHGFHTRRTPWGACPDPRQGGHAPTLAAVAANRDANAHLRTDPEENEMLLPKQTLTPEAKRAFRIFANPFDGDVQTDEQMFVGREVAYVREACWQCAVAASFVAVVGESGAGKTTILGDVESRIQREARHCIVIRPSVLGMEDSDNKGKTLKSTDILHAIITTLDPLATVPQTLQARTKKAQEMLTASVQAGNSHVLLIEEAHSMPDATLKHLKRMHELRTARRPLMGILLLAQTELKLRLDSGLRGGHLREVAQRIEIVQLLPLDDELGMYLRHRSKAAGRELDEFIDAEGVEAIRLRLTRQAPGSNGKGRTVSLCYPLAVNNLVIRALNEAASLGAPRITRDIVLSV